VTAPLVPSDCDLRDFQYMPLDVVRLRDSELVTAVTGEEAFVAVLLWCAAWHQVPAASLPDDDRQLANLAGYGRAIKEWLKVKAGALRGFVRCDDGRLYHPVVAEKAREAWDAKLQQRYRTECARIKKVAQRHDVSPIYPTFDEWLSQGTRGKCPEGQPPMSPKCPEGQSIQGKGREGKGIDIPNPTSGHTPPSAAGSVDVESNGSDRVGQFEGHEGIPSTTPNPVARFAIALTRAGFQITSQNPILLAYVAEGGTVEHLLQCAQLDDCTGKKAAYPLAIARRELAEKASAVTAGTPPASTPARSPDGVSPRVDRETERQHLAESMAEFYRQYPEMRPSHAA
jgi:hypothetical protein